MLTVINANGKKACQVDPINRLVEVVHKKFKVVVEFLSDDAVAISTYDEEGTLASTQYIAPP